MNFPWRFHRDSLICSWNLTIGGSNQNESGMQFIFGECVIDTESFEVLRAGSPVKVEPQVFDMLVLLAKNHDRVVSKDEIVETIWDGRAVSDAAVNSRIMSARRAVGDDGTEQRCIRTIRSRGYRMVADVEIVAPNGSRENGPHASNAATASKDSTKHAALDMPTGPKIVVFPFDRRARGETAEFFCNAIVDEITAALIRFTELRVSAGIKSAAIHETGTDHTDIGRKSGAAYILEGSLQSAGERSRITARLTGVTDDRVLWSEIYEPRLTAAHLFEVQDDIASNVVAAIASVSGGVIARETIRRASGEAVPSLHAYEASLRALEIMTSGFTPESHLATRQRLEEILAEEPDYSTAWAMLAWTHSVEHTEGHNRRTDSDPRERSLEAARRAIELEFDNPIAHFAMARAAFIKGDIDLFRQEADIALRLNPHEPFLLGCLGNWLAFSGRWEEGTKLASKAIALSPNGYPRWWHASIGKNYYRKGDYAKALAEFKQINLPKWWWNQLELSYTYGQIGDTPKARAAATALQELYPGFNLRTAVEEHQKFNFRPEYIDLAVQGLRKAGILE